MYGEGAEREAIQFYIDKIQLGEVVTLHGNATAQTVRNAYQNAHFLILPSVSEGWPKVVAESMFWGCVPLASAVSCVPMMLDNGSRGVVLKMDVDSDVVAALAILADSNKYHQLSGAAMDWSRQYTLEVFEHDIRQILKS
jgi:glycosyltransferase involved in cell wall biosynthesis